MKPEVGAWYINIIGEYFCVTYVYGNMAYITWYNTNYRNSKWDFLKFPELLDAKLPPLMQELF